jgi:anti-anti-sigma factor
MKPSVEPHNDWRSPGHRDWSDDAHPRLSVVAQDDRVVQLLCKGQLTPIPTLLDADPLADVIGPARPGRSVVLDLSHTDYINSTGISWLIQTHKYLAKTAGALVLHSLSPQVYSALKIVNLLNVLKVAADQPAALAVVNSQKP